LLNRKHQEQYVDNQEYHSQGYINFGDLFVPVPPGKDLFVPVLPGKDLFVPVPPGEDDSLGSRNTVCKDREHQ
jgi:hypothetical protein